MVSNPLIVLGVPGELAASELASGSLGRLRAAIKGSYKNLSRFYHPDRGGDAEQMASYSRANSEIEAASDMVLTFWIEEMVDAKTLRNVDQLDQLREQLAERGMTVRHLLGTAVGVDQFSITGSTAPCSFLCDLAPGSFDQLVIEVRSPSDTVASLAFRREVETDIGHMSDRIYHDGIWYDVLLNQHGNVVRKYPVVLSNPVSVTIIGRANLDHRPEPSFVDVSTRQLETPPSPRGIAWHDPLTTWFMPKLEHTQKGSFVLVDATGKRVALTGNVIATSR
jgi:hypothetical protein